MTFRVYVKFSPQLYVLHSFCEITRRLIPYNYFILSTQPHTPVTFTPVTEYYLTCRSLHMVDHLRKYTKRTFSSIEMRDKPNDTCFNLSTSNWCHLEAPPPSHMLFAICKQIMLQHVYCSLDLKMQHTAIFCVCHRQQQLLTTHIIIPGGAKYSF